MVWEHLHAEEAPNVGDDFDSVAEMHGEAPLCDCCGDKQAERKVDHRDLCGDCIGASTMTNAEQPSEVTATDPEVMAVFDRFNGLADKETAVEIVRQLRNPDDEWIEVQRSTPTEYVIGVPDEAVVWYCLEHYTHSTTITVYWVPDSGEAYVSVSGEEVSMAVEDFEEIGRAVAYADGVAAALEVPE